MGSSRIGTSEVVYAEVELTYYKSLYFLPRKARTDFYFGVILPSVTYGMLVWSSCGQVLFSNLESILLERQNKMLRNISCMRQAVTAFHHYTKH